MAFSTFKLGTGGGKDLRPTVYCTHCQDLVGLSWDQTSKMGWEGKAMALLKSDGLTFVTFLNLQLVSNLIV
jgi:hypothetical protein